MSVDAARFEPLRALLIRHTYRMLGEHAEAEDVVHDAFERWKAALSTGVINDDRAFLRATVTQLCIDRSRSAPRPGEKCTLVHGCPSRLSRRQETIPKRP